MVNELAAELLLWVSVYLIFVTLFVHIMRRCSMSHEVQVIMLKNKVNALQEKISDMEYKIIELGG